MRSDSTKCSSGGAKGAMKLIAILFGSMCAWLGAFTPVARAQNETPRPTGFTLLTDELTSDFKYVVDNVQMDAVDIVTSPLYIASDRSALRSPNFYLGLAG